MTESWNIAQAADRYFTGDPCVSCGGRLRYLKHRRCVQCNRRKSLRLANAKYRGDPRHREKCKLKMRTRWASDPIFREYQSRCRRIARGTPEPTRPQPANCEICGRPRKLKSLHIDHCHATGSFRGWLCSQCNTGLGLLGDSVENLGRAVAYLRRSADRS